MTLITNPGAVSVATTDYPDIQFDASPILNPGETITAATVRVQSADFTRQIALPDSPSFTATSVSQLVKGSLLTAGSLYRLIWILTLSSGDVISQQTSCQVPY